MIYLDTSVALAWLLTEDRQPPASFWDETLVSSRLLEYEIWTPLHARGLADSHGAAARQLVGRVALLELTPRVLARALDAFPGPGRCGPSTPCIWRRARIWRIKVRKWNSRATTGG